jgi:hypothetical protein
MTGELSRSRLLHNRFALASIVRRFAAKSRRRPGRGCIMLPARGRPGRSLSSSSGPGRIGCLERVTTRQRCSRTVLEWRKELRHMNLPQFTAEASLGRANRIYRRAPLASSIGSLVVPALCFPDGCGPCRNGVQRCCEGGHIVFEKCEPPPPPITCGPCIGVRHCSNGQNRPCTVP